jgi:Arc/MetJ-type ribon-helix-helix transcriptional regulator
MTIELKPEQERVIRQQLASGHFKSVDEVLATALARLPYRPRSNRSAVARRSKFSKQNSIKLPLGETVEGLVREGHRY